MGPSGRNILFKLSFKWSQLRSLSTVSKAQQPFTTNKQDKRNLGVSNVYLNGYTLRFHLQTYFVPFYWSEKLKSLAMRVQEYTIRGNTLNWPRRMQCRRPRNFNMGATVIDEKNYWHFIAFKGNDRRGDSNFLLLTFPYIQLYSFRKDGLKWPWNLSRIHEQSRC